LGGITLITYPFLLALSVIVSFESMTERKNTMKNLGYVRVSHLESLNGDSFETQSKKIENYSSLHDFKINRIWTEVVSGGIEVRKRKTLSDVVSQLSRGDRLVVARLDRLSRNILDTLKFVNDCRKKGIDIHIVDLGCVTNGGVGQIVLNVLTCLAETERIQISERIKAQKHFAKQERKFLGGALEFGYKKDEKGKLIPDEKEQIILQSMFNLRNQGLGYRKISDEIKKKYGRKIFFQQVHKIMTREHNQKFFNQASTTSSLNERRVA